MKRIVQVSLRRRHEYAALGALPSRASNASLIQLSAVSAMGSAPSMMSAPPVRAPNAIVDRLNREFVKAAHTPELIAKLTENGNIVASSTPQEMSRLVAEEVKNMEQLIKTLGLKAQ